MLNYLGPGDIIRARLVYAVSAGDLVLSALGEIQGTAVTDGAADEIIAVVNFGVIYLPSTGLFTTDYQKVYVRTADLAVVSSPLPVLESSDPILTPKQTGGILSTGDYYYGITVSDAYGESVISDVVMTTIAGIDDTVQLDWNPVTDVVTYNIYRGVTSDDLYFIGSVSAPTITLDDDGLSLQVAQPPDFNSTGTQYIGRYLDGYTGQIEVRGSLTTNPDGTVVYNEVQIDQEWVPAGSIPVLLKLS